MAADGVADLHTTRWRYAKGSEQRREPVRFESPERFTPPLRVTILPRPFQGVEDDEVLALE